MTTRRARTLARTALLVVLVAVTVLATLSWHRRASYQKAESLSSAGRVAEAYEIFSGLGGYRDAEQRAQALASDDPALPYRSARKGDVLAFGTYEQDNDAANGAEAVQWIVLDRIEDRLLLLSASCLDSRPYNLTPFEAVTWETSDLRAWLNNEFLTTAFTPSEQRVIHTSHNRNADQSVVGTVGGADTDDDVFVLSETDTVIYLDDDVSRDYLGRAPATAHAATGQVHVDAEGMADWWLRSPGGYGYAAQYVGTTGEPSVSGAYVDAEYGVRPALWLDVAQARGGPG